MQPQVLKTNEPILIRNIEMPAWSVKFYTKPNDFQNPVAEITPEGVFRVHVDPTDEVAREFVDLVNRVLSGKAAPLTAMEVINGEQDCHAQ